MKRRLVGQIVNHHHSATPVVVGDFETMKGWPGDPDGGSEGDAAVVGAPEAANLVYFPPIECTSPGVPAIYLEGDVVWIVADSGAWEGPDATPLPDAPFAPGPGRGVVPVASGGLVLALAYNCTPAADVDTSEWEEEENFVPDETPHLPQTIPAEGTAYAEQLVVVPVEAGVYALATDVVDGVFRCRIARVSDEELEPYAAGLDWENWVFEYEPHG